MKTRIGFSRARGLPGLLSRLICFISGSPASHAWILYYDQDFKMDMVMEASEFGFRLEPFRVFRQKNEIVEIYEPRYPVDGGLAAAADWLGAEYDFAGLLGMTVVELGRRLKKRWRNPFRGQKTQFCSEAVCRMLRAASYPGADQLEPDDCDPGDLISLLKKTGSLLWKVP